VAESDEVIVRETVAAGSALDGATLGAAELGTQTGMRVVAVRRADAAGADRWVLQPGPETALAADDAVLAKGTRAGADRLRKRAQVASR
jgi:uncharacterized protein with PhoU and TrkA domain